MVVTNYSATGQKKYGKKTKTRPRRQPQKEIKMIKKNTSLLKPQQMTTLRSGKSKQIFPHGLHIKCNTHFLETMNASNAYVRSYKGNSFFEAGPATAYGGVYSANVPSGLYYLISSSASTGAQAPYQSYRIKNSKISIELCATQNATTAGNNIVPVYLFIIPSTKATLAGMTITQLEEQPYCKKIFVPPTNFTNNPVRLRHAIDSAAIFGDAPIEIQDSEYESTILANPSNVWFWHVEVRCANTGAGIVADLYMDVRINYDVELFNLNQFVTTIPT